MVLWLALLLATGLLAAGLLFLRYKKKDGSTKRTGTRWRQAEYYSRFLAQLSQEQRQRFGSMGEAEQFKAYMDWSLREGLGHADQKVRS
ncbi:MAG: hypothetical protein Q8S19_00430 [Bacillota bacterium]|nr:hypothetical protein [Bacillota bacterium]